MLLLISLFFMMPFYGFSKQERLCNTPKIENLFSFGHSFSVYPFYIKWMPVSCNQPFPCQLLISVSKRKFKRAVDRNLLKRRMREAYRKNKHSLYDGLNEQEKKIIFSVSYIAKERCSFATIEKSMQRVIFVLLTKKHFQ